MKKLPHFYWTKKNIAFNGEFLQEAKRKSGLLVDPFMGSGSLILGIDPKKFKTVGIELNEMPVFMLKAFLENLNAKELTNSKKEFDLLKSKYGSLYDLACPKCASNCNYDRFVFDNNNGIDIHKIKCLCQNCGYEFDDKKTNKKAIEQLTENFIHYSKKCNDTNDSLLTKNSRIAVKDGMKISDIFSPINFYILNNIKEKHELSNLSRYVLGSILHNTRLTDERSQSQFPYWVPSVNILNKNIFKLIDRKLKELEKYISVSSIKVGKKISDINQSDVTILHGPSQSILDKFDDESIDIVLTDPPYYDQVAYSEYLKIWEFFLDFDSDFANELIETNRSSQPSDRSMYLEKMSSIFSLLYKKMKRNSDLIIYFKDSKEKNYMDFISLMINSGFRFIKQKHLNAKKITYKQVSSTKTTSRGDCIIFFSKSNAKLKENNTTNLSKDGLVELIIKSVKEYLNKNQKASTGELLDNVIYYQIISSNLMYELNEKEIIKLLDANFNFVENLWELK